MFFKQWNDTKMLLVPEPEMQGMNVFAVKLQEKIGIGNVTW